LANAQGSVTAQYAYDSYGVMLGQTSGAQQRQATSLLYSGEQFDSTLQQYHLGRETTTKPTVSSPRSIPTPATSTIRSPCTNTPTAILIR